MQNAETEVACTKCAAYQSPTAVQLNAYHSAKPCAGSEMQEVMSCLTKLLERAAVYSNNSNRHRKYIRYTYAFAAKVNATQTEMRHMQVYAADFDGVQTMMRSTYVYAAAAWGGCLLRWQSAFQQGHLLVLKGTPPLVKLFQSQVAGGSGCKLCHSLGQSCLTYVDLGHNLTAGEFQACTHREWVHATNTLASVAMCHHTYGYMQN